MTTINEFMLQDHRRCDDFFATAEAAVNKGDWELAEGTTRDYLEAMEHHFRMEEEILFRAFETMTGMTSGPTAVMRQEHQQIRQLLEQLQAALDNKNFNDFFGVSETLLIMTQQHNMKEEGILYPMMDNVLSEEGPQLIQKAKNLP